MKLIVRCAGLLLLATVAHSHTTEGCSTYTWDLARELAALEAPGTSIVARSNPTGRKRWLNAGERYDATLVPQPEVRFVMPPGRARALASPAGGLLFFRSGKAGRYRVSLSTHHWIDLVDGRKPIVSIAHEGRSGCASLHKVVEFELPARRAITIQLSGAESGNVSVVITGPA